MNTLAKTLTWDPQWPEVLSVEVEGEPLDVLPFYGVRMTANRARTAQGLVSAPVILIDASCRKSTRESIHRFGLAFLERGTHLVHYSPNPTKLALTTRTTRRLHEALTLVSSGGITGAAQLVTARTSLRTAARYLRTLRDLGMTSGKRGKELQVTVLGTEFLADPGVGISQPPTPKASTAQRIRHLEERVRELEQQLAELRRRRK